MSSSLKKILVETRDSIDDIAEAVAGVIREIIDKKEQKEENAVIAFPAGNTYIPIYKKLREWYSQRKINFSNVVAFSLDEYYGLNQDHPKSCNRFLRQNLFNHVNIKKENLHLITGNISIENVKQYCEQYEKKIEEDGGLDLALLGFGRNGHIAFNETYSNPEFKTRLIRLAESTREDLASNFSEEEVPEYAITMGINTVLNAKRIVGVGTNKDKLSEIMKKIIYGPVTKEVPASYLQQHENTQIFLTKELVSAIRN